MKEWWATLRINGKWTEVQFTLEKDEGDVGVCVHRHLYEYDQHPAPRRTLKILAVVDRSAHPYVKLRRNHYFWRVAKVRLRQRLHHGQHFCGHIADDGHPMRAPRIVFHQLEW